MTTRRQFLGSIFAGVAGFTTGVLKPAAAAAAPAAVIPAARIRRLTEQDVLISAQWCQTTRMTSHCSDAYLAELDRIMRDADVSKFQSLFRQ